MRPARLPFAPYARILRVFPRRTTATPKDDWAVIGPPGRLKHEPKDVLEVHISVTFTWDIEEAERLRQAYGRHYDVVKVGGPALNDQGGQFTPGMYLAPGRTITSRGCHRHCGFCLVHPREGNIRTLDIKPGNDIFDNNLLACPRPHIEAVMEMLAHQPEQPRFTGGIDARLVEPWWVEQAVALQTEILYTAYDRPTEIGPVARAISMMRDAGLRRRAVGCYVLIGYYDDTVRAAKDRLEHIWDLGAMPYAMYYQPPDGARGTRPLVWRSFVREWSRPAIIAAKHKALARPPSQLEPTL